MRLQKLIIFFMSYIFLSSCRNVLGNNETPIELNPKTQSNQQIDEQKNLSLDFISVKKAVFSARCTFCHQQYNDYQSVIRELSAIQAAVAADRMPKSGGPLSDKQKLILTQWITDGTPEFADGTNQPALPVVLEPIWKSVSENIIVPKCLVCHNPQGQAKFLDLSSREHIYENRDRIFGNNSKFIDSDKPENSYLIQIVSDEEEPMPPTWSNISRLTEEEIKILTKWISLGLP